MAEIVHPNSGESTKNNVGPVNRATRQVSDATLHHVSQNPGGLTEFHMRTSKLMHEVWRVPFHGRKHKPAARDFFWVACRPAFPWMPIALHGKHAVLGLPCKGGCNRRPGTDSAAAGLGADTDAMIAFLALDSYTSVSRALAASALGGPFGGLTGTASNIEAPEVHGRRRQVFITPRSVTVSAWRGAATRLQPSQPGATQSGFHARLADLPSLWHRCRCNPRDRLSRSPARAVPELRAV